MTKIARTLAGLILGVVVILGTVLSTSNTCAEDCFTYDIALTTDCVENFTKCERITVPGGQFQCKAEFSIVDIYRDTYTCGKDPMPNLTQNTKCAMEYIRVQGVPVLPVVRPCYDKKTCQLQFILPAMVVECNPVGAITTSNQFTKITIKCAQQA